MINIIYNEAGQDMVLRAEGHAEYAPKGQDIVCAAASMLAYTAGYMLVQAEERGEARDVVGDTVGVSACICA